MPSPGTACTVVLTFCRFPFDVASGSGGVRSTSPCSTCSVIVVGAGFGGLAAARFLHNSNVKVRVSGVVGCVVVGSD